MADTFLVSVADAIGIDPSTGNALFNGTANISSAFTLSMSSSDVRAGRNNGLRFKYMHTRDLGVNIEQAIFEKTFIALNAGSNVLNQTVNVLNTECVQLTGGVGTLSETPQAGVEVNVIKGDGTIVQVTPSGTTITVPGSGDEKVDAIYRYSDTVDRISISSTEPPNIITLVLTAEVRNTDGELVERLQVEVPNFQIDGNYELSLSADGVSTESLSGMALSVGGVTCTDGDIYAYVSWIPVSLTSVPVAYIAATPANFEPTAGTEQTQQITVTAIRGGIYQNFNVTSGLTFAVRTGGDSDVTVSGTGLITVADTATTGDSAIIDVTYNDGTTSHTDVVAVEVQ